MILFNKIFYGNWNEVKLSHLSIFMSECENQNENQNDTNFCATKEEINNYISRGISLVIYFLDYRVQINDFARPTSYFLNTAWMFSTSYETKFTNIELQKHVIETDSGLFFEDKSTVEYLRVIESKTDTMYIKENSKDRGIFYIYSSNKSDFTFRKYIKVPDLIASIGGLVDILFLIFGFLNTPFVILKGRVL
jgi:hypothetical protein